MAYQKCISQISSTFNNTNTSNVSAAISKATTTSQEQQQQQPGFSYILYLHREELRKRKASFMRISSTKFQLTHELITKTVQNIHKCSSDDLQILSRETIFKKNLRRQIARMKYHQLMQMAKYHKEQNNKFHQQQQTYLLPTQHQQSATTISTIPSEYQ